MYLSQENKKARKEINARFQELGLPFIKNSSKVLCSAKVSSYKQFEDVIKIIAQQYSKSTFYYRGQSCIWNVAPTLARGFSPNFSTYQSNLIDREYALYSGCLTEKTRYHNDIKELDWLELLQKYQHYGMPTRLLDITSSYDIALFFACEDTTYYKKDGCVYVFLSNNYSNDEELKKFLIEQPKIMKDNRFLSFEEMVKQYYAVNEVNSDFESFKKSILQYYHERCPLYVKGIPALDDRISHQSASFLLFGNALWDYKSYMRGYKAFGINSTEPQFIRNRLQYINLSKVLRIDISCEIKSKILYTLREKDPRIDMEYIYPSFESYIKSYVRNFKENLSSRNN